MHTQIFLKSKFLTVIFFFVFIFLSYILFAPKASAANIVVTTTANGYIDGQCTIHTAIAAANSDTAVRACVAGSGPDTITLPSGISI